MKEEVWLPIKGWECFYEVSSWGKVKRLKREVYHLRRSDVKPHILKERIWKGFLEVNGYRCVALQDSQNGRRENCKVHRLVAEAFIPNPENKPCVNHMDGIKENNHLSNLEWVTIAENIRHASKIGLLKGALDARGTKNSQAKLSESDIRKIRQLKREGMLHKEIADIFNVSRTCITNIVNRKLWSHVE